MRVDHRRAVARVVKAAFPSAAITDGAGWQGWIHVLVGAAVALLPPIVHADLQHHTYGTRGKGVSALLLHTPNVIATTRWRIKE